MERKEGKKFNFKICGLVAIAVVAAIVGTLVFTNYEPNSDSQTQSIGIGAYVTIEAYHEDGTLFQKWEGHNRLTQLGQSAIALCLGGFFQNFLDICETIHTDTIILFAGNEAGGQETTEFEAVTTRTPIPETCLDIGDVCTGWKLEGTHDFDTLNCTPGVDCLELRFIGSRMDIPDLLFNEFDVQPVVPIVPNDRVVVTMNFEVPE